MRLIDADMLCKYCDNNINHSITPNEIMRMPFIDAEPIVRCKNCEFVDTLECPMNYIDHQRLIFSNRSPDWFCAEGVSKDET